MALHFSNAVPSTASVWLAGPCRIIGGGLSVKTKGQRYFSGYFNFMKFGSLYISSSLISKVRLKPQSHTYYL